MLRSPRLLGEQYLGLFSDFLPEIREKVYEGVEDGSIKTEYPEELADLIVYSKYLDWFSNFRFFISRIKAQNEFH